MSKHSTTPRTLSRRLAALLAALALLAAMALPVYGEASDGTTQKQEIVETDNNGETDNGVETGSDVETDGKSETEDTGTGTESEDTNDNASSNTTGDSNTTAGDAANDTPRTLPDGSIDTTAGKITTNGILDTMNEDAKQNIVTRSTDDAETADDETADDMALYDGVTTDEYFDIYFALPKAWEGAQKISFEALRGNHNDGSTGTKEMTLVDGRGTTADGKKIYKINLHYKQGDTSVDCPYKGFAKITFTKDDDTTGISAKLTVDTNDSRFFWQEYETLKDRYYDSDKQEWISIAELKPRHTHFADKTFTFKNMTTNDLTNVKAIFYDKAEGSTELTQVKAENLNTVSAKDNATVTIPNEACAYVAFFVDDVQLGSCFNFCNDDSTTANVTSFLYSESQNCFVYTTSGDVVLTEDGARKIYYDATFSKLSLKTGNAIPSTVGGNVYYYMYKSSDTGNRINGQMTYLSDNLYSIDAKEGYDRIIFASYDSISLSSFSYNGSSTDALEIPSENRYVQPCFYADTGDASMFNSFDGNRRDGYWAELGTFRNAEENKPGKQVVDISQAPFAADSQTKYINTTLYDYYSDWELNGNNRDNYAQFNTNDGQQNTFANDANAYRNWVTFGQFDQALSDYYQKDSTKTVLYPMYTGQFQPAAYDYENNQDKLWGFGFAAVADSLNLYGYSGSVNKFMAVNNSTININGTGLSSSEKNQRFYAYTFQGLTGKTLVDGNPVLYDTNLTVPYFNEDFLLRNNSKNAKLGEVYDNVSFPFTKSKNVFNGGNEDNVEYWYFDSHKTTLYLKQDKGKGYFLQKSDDQSKSRNLKSNSDYQDSESYGFFPFNEHSTEHQASTYNYGFGAKLQFEFTMTDDGQIYGTDGVNKVPIKFFFSGDDDVWVYIDNDLALDVGGDHGKASGLLEFSKNSEGALVYTPYVSNVKASNAQQMYESVTGCKSINYLNATNTITFNYRGEEKTITPGEHTLTMYYMERGMWESNMAVAFNFPDHNELEVEKKVDLSDVNKDVFGEFFKDTGLFGFTIKNLATHYGGKSVTPLGTVNTVEITDSNSTARPKGTNTFTSDTVPGNTGQQALHWFADYKDDSSDHRDERYGVIEVDQSKLSGEEKTALSNMAYLSFDVYTQESANLSLSNLYLELEDSDGHRLGSLRPTGLSGKTYDNTSELKQKQWVTIKLDLSRLTKQGNFNLANLKYIYIGDNYPLHLYIKNVKFTSKAAVTANVGFTTAQNEIPDYGSALNNKDNALEWAAGAQFTSDRTNGTQAVDENGRFRLKDGETITFKDQFRRGSYISVTEDDNSDLYDTTWTICENDTAVKSMTDGNTITNPSGSTSLGDCKGRTPDDGRTEKAIQPTGGDGSGNSYYQYGDAGKKPATDGAIVFRSYSDPDMKNTTELVSLKLQFVNKVKTGSITIKKKSDGSAIPAGTKFRFKITYTNVGGQNLENGATVTEERDVAVDGTEVIKGIPAGTHFTIEEMTSDSDTAHLLKVSAEGESAKVVNNKTVQGTVQAGNKTSVTATFTNTTRTLIELNLTKQWKGQNGKVLNGNDLPDTIYVRLQRRVEGSQDWTPVNYPETNTQGYIAIGRDAGGWNYTFASLDEHDPNNQGCHYEYRVVEGTVSNGVFTPADKNNKLTINGKVYEVSGGTPVDKTITLINTQQNPKFNLDVIKKSADEDKVMTGVEFKLEKLLENGTDVDSNFEAKTLTTDTQGKITGFTNLEAGIYRLTETKTLSGYSLLSGPILVKFDVDGSCKLNGETVSSDTSKTPAIKPNDDGSYTLTLTVLNRKTPALPHTGADAPSLWLLIGLPLAVAGLLILVFRYNKKGGRTR